MSKPALKHVPEETPSAPTAPASAPVAMGISASESIRALRQRPFVP